MPMVVATPSSAADSSSSSSSAITDLRQELDRLMKARDALETEAQAIREQLTSVGPNGEPPAGLTGTPLVDKEGFPRADIDVYEVRGKRHRLACIDTDHQETMKAIEALLVKLHTAARATMPDEAASRPSSSLPPPPPPSREDLEDAVVASLEAKLDPSTTTQPSPLLRQQQQAVTLKPFALVDQVFRGSPAEESGLQVGDQVVRFGSLDSTNHSNLTALPGVVQNSVNRALSVVLRRGLSTVTVELTPHTWSGRGLLGCHLSPVAPSS